MSFLPAFEYLAGFAFFGFVYWLLNGIRTEIQGISETGTVYDLAIFVWTATIFIYIIFGGIWVVREYTKDKYNNRGGMF